jgi:DnaK suppressor protein
MIDHQQTAAVLRRRLAELTGRIERLEEDLRQPLDADFAEQATTMEGAEASQALEESSRAEVAQIAAALARIDEGTYGVCATCGEDIAEARLEALPYAVQCIECARKK